MTDIMGVSALPTGLSSFGSSQQAVSPVPASIPNADDLGRALIEERLYHAQRYSAAIAEVNRCDLIASDLVWRALSDVAWQDGRDVVLLAHGMEVQARFCAGEWSDDTPVSPREYSGAVWSCFDDEFQIEIEETSPIVADWRHGPATHWRNLTPRPPQGIETQGAATTGAVGEADESPVPEGNAP